jgi:hypothetical protein
MKRERMDIKPGDRIRCPDRATAAWHTVVRTGRRRDGTRYVTLRRGRFWRALGLPAMQRIEWSELRGFGYGIRRARPAAFTGITNQLTSDPEETEAKHEC